MSLDALDEMICNGEMQADEIMELCADSEKTKEDILATVRDLDQKEAEDFAMDLEQQWDEAWEYLDGDNAFKLCAFSAVTTATTLFAFAI